MFRRVYCKCSLFTLITVLFTGLAVEWEFPRDICDVCINVSREKWVPVTTAWRVLRLRMEERPPIWRVAANVLTKQSRTDDKGWSFSLGTGRGAYISPSNISRCEMFTQKASDLDCFRDRWRALGNAEMNLRVP
jgi:hypothetical protein